MPELNQKLEQKLLQKLSPQQIQLIKLLEVPIVELEQRIKKEIEENPALEEDNNEITDIDRNSDENQQETDENSDFELDSDNDFDEAELREEADFSIEDYFDDDEIPNYRLKDNNYGEETESPQTFYSVGDSFQEFLYSQLAVLELDERSEQIAKYILGNLDEAGYLRREPASIANDMLFLFNFSVTPDEVEKILKMIQNELDPPGIGARNLQECLIIQIKRKLKDNEDDEILNLTLTIISDFFDTFSKKHYQKLKNKLDINDEQLRQVINEVLKLNPKPGNSYSQQSKRNILQIIPDFIVKIRDGEPYLELNSMNVPPLRINKTFENMVQTYNEKNKKSRKDKETISFIKQKLESAKWFIDAIKQRQNTLERTMLSILEYQKEFFRTGDERKLKPMILKDIAEKTKLDISTISRVANSKYVQTPYGIFPLKFFFSEGMENAKGEEVSTRQIKKILQEAIENEDKSKPLTDEKLAELLQEKGFKIARRTVAKYREQIGILVARLRKEL
jgi:RNA polymerase sigma-54 factor